MVVDPLYLSLMLSGRCAVWRQLGAAAVQAAAVQRTTQCQVQGHRCSTAGCRLLVAAAVNTPSPLTARELQHGRRRASLSCPRRKNSVFCRRIKMRILPRPAVACKICVQSTKLLIRVGEGEECWDQNEDDTPFSADMQAMFNYV